MDLSTFMALAIACAPQVDPSTAYALVATESSFNPNAIGVVGGVLERQPRTQPEARATARNLDAQGWNYSVGLAQINVHNFTRLRLDLESAFDPCANLRAMQTLLEDCFDRASIGKASAQAALRDALSCYYSGNFSTGFQHGYVWRVVSAAALPSARSASPLRP